MTTTDPRLTLPGVDLHRDHWRVRRTVDGVRQRALLALDATAADLVRTWEGFAAATSTAAAGSLADAVATYLPTVAAKPTAGQIAAHLAILVRELGRERSAASVTPADIDCVIQRWLTTPTTIAQGSRGRPSGVDGLAGDTIRKRLANWQSFFAVALPAGAVNPVKACTQRPAPAAPATRGLPIDDVVRILAAMPEWRDTADGQPRQRALGKLRATVAAWTALDPAQIQRLTRSDLHLTGPNPYVRVGRRKGAGVAIVYLPVTDAGRDALQAFADANAFGPYSATAVNRSVKAAAAAVGIARGTFRAKDLRHSFLTELYRQTRDQATVGRFALHAEGSPMTARYTRAAHELVDRAAAAAFVVPKPAEQPAAVLAMNGRQHRKRDR